MDDDLIGTPCQPRCDPTVFKREVEEMRRTLQTGLGAGADAAARGIESALVRAVRTGKLGFEELKATALSVLADIAAASVRSGMQSLIGSIKGGGSKSEGGLSSLIGTLSTPGRATGGPVSPGQAYVVGERGPELFVPTSSGRVETGAPGAVREVRVSISINAAAGAAPAVLAQSSRQVARAVRAALAED
jgi:phage-related minor tail protein